MKSVITCPLGVMPIPVVVIVILSIVPFGMTLVSPVIIATSTSLAVSSMDRNIFFKSEIGNPSSMIKALAIAIGLAPITATSLIVPDVANLPISPPGKNIGSTVCPSVLITSSISQSCKEIVAPSSKESNPMLSFETVRFENDFNTRSDNSSSIMLPPAP